MIEVTIDQASKERIKASLNRLVSKDDQENIIKRGVLKTSTYVLGVLLTNVTGVILKVRTGNLARSMGMRVEKQGDNWVGIVGSGALVINPQMAQEGTVLTPIRADKTFRMVYADRLETGGRITPTGGRKYLTIPTKHAKTPAGVTRFTAPQVRAGETNYDGSIILFPYIYGYETKFVGGKGGGIVKSRKLTPLFKLVSEVNMPAKKYLSTTATSVSTHVGDIMAQEIEKGLKE